MKQLIYFCLFSSLLLFSCKEESVPTTTGDTDPPGKVTNLVSKSGYGEVTLKWTKPSDADFDYTSIEYTKNGKPVTLKARADSITVDGFENTDSYEFSLYAVDQAQNKSEVSKITAAPGQAPNNLVINEITATPIEGGARIAWKNTTGKQISVSVKYVFETEKTQSKTSDKSVDSIDIVFSEAQTVIVSANSGNSKLQKEISITPIKLINSINAYPIEGGIAVAWKNPTNKPVSILINYVDDSNAAKVFTVQSKKSADSVEIMFSKPQTITASVVYETLNIPNSFDVVPLVLVKFNKSQWSVPGYVEGSQSATIGYSSQATNEGAAPNGRVKAIFDENINTFWHASWSPASSYPHWFIIDMGSEKTVVRIEMTRRQNNGSGQIGHQFLTCTEAGAANPADPTTWAWEDQGTYPFSQSTLTPQGVKLDKKPRARYIKVYMSAANKGTGNYAILAEMSVFGYAD